MTEKYQFSLSFMGCKRGFDNRKDKPKIGKNFITVFAPQIRNKSLFEGFLYFAVRINRREKMNYIYFFFIFA